MEGGAESAPAIPLVQANEAAAFATMFTTGVQPASANQIILDPIAPAAIDFTCLAQVETDEMIDALAATNRATARGITMRLPVVNPLVIHIDAMPQPLTGGSIPENADAQVSGAEPLETIDPQTILLAPLAIALPIEPAPIANEIEIPEIQKIVEVQLDRPMVNGESTAIQVGDALQHLETSKRVLLGDTVGAADMPDLVQEILPQADRSDREYISSVTPGALVSKAVETPALQSQNNLSLAQTTSTVGMSSPKNPDAGIPPNSIPSAPAPVMHSDELKAELSEAPTKIETTEATKPTESIEEQPETQIQLLADATRVDAIAATFRNLVSNPQNEQIDDLNAAPENIPHPSFPQVSRQTSPQASVQRKLVTRLASHEQANSASGTLDAHTVAYLTQRQMQAPKEPASNPVAVAVAISLPKQGDGAHVIRGVDVQEGEQDRPREQDMTQDSESDQREHQGRNGRAQVNISEVNESKDETQGSTRHQQTLREEFRNVLKDIEVKTETKLEGLNRVITEPALPQSDGQNTTSGRAIAVDARFSPMTETGSSESRAQANEMRMRALERQIVNAVKEGSDTIRMQLYPPGLGQVVIRLTTEGGRLRMISRTQSQEATDALRQVEHDLRNALGSDGIQLTEFDVSDHNDGDGRRQTQDTKIIITRSAKSESFAIDMNA